MIGKRIAPQMVIQMIFFALGEDAVLYIFTQKRNSFFISSLAGSFFVAHILLGVCNPKKQKKSV